MNWPAYLQAAMEELDAFLASPRNAEWRDTMQAKVANCLALRRFAILHFVVWRLNNYSSRS